MRDFDTDDFGFSSQDQGHRTINLFADGHSPVTVSDPALLFMAEFARQGRDLLLQNDSGSDIRIVDYFAHSAPADLATPEGAVLRGALVEKLAGPATPGQYAQVGASDITPIGQVETVDGTARVQRADGTVEILSVGTKVYQNDVVSTEEGSKLSVTFVDGTMFTLAAASRMVLDELVYTPGGAGNSAVFSLVEGGFVFVAGQVAKTGDMEIGTPSATMGIRGTTGVVEIATLQGTLTVSIALAEDFDGSGTGVIQVFDLDGNLVAEIDGVDQQWVIPIDGEAYAVERTTSELDSDAEILADAATAFAIAYARFEGTGGFVNLGGTSTTPGSGDPGTAPDGDSEDGGGEGGSDGGGSGQPGTTTGGTDPSGTTTPFQDGLDPTELGGGDPDNNAPVPTDISATGQEDAVLSGQLTASDSDGDDLTFSIITPPSNGTVVLLEDGQYSFIPDPDFNGTDSFTYQVSDGKGGSAQGVVTLQVDGVNDLPVIRDAASFEAQEDTPLSGDLSTLVSDVDGGELTFELVGPSPLASTLSGGLLRAAAATIGTAANGTVTIEPDGHFTYTPNENFSGTDSFTFRVTDSQGGSVTGTVTITVTSSNDAPLAQPSVGVFSTVEDIAMDGSLASLATDADGDALTFSLAQDGAPGKGTVVINTDGSFRYTPDADATGTDTFTYQVDDGNGGSSTATVQMTITGMNDTPTTTAGTASTQEDTAVSGDLNDFVADVDGDTLSFALTDTGTPQHGTVVVNANGSFTYTPNPDSDSNDSFTYEVSDGAGGTATGTVAITVALVNDAPAATGGAMTVAEDSILTGTLATLATDLEGDTLTFRIAPDSAVGLSTEGLEEPGSPPTTNGPAHGTLTIAPDGSFTYTPDSDYNGPDSFTYEVDDGNGGRAQATITLNVTPVNDPPYTLDDEKTTAEDTAVSGDLTLVSGDVDGDTLTFGIATYDLYAEGFPSGSGSGFLEFNLEGLEVEFGYFYPGPEFGTVVLNPDGTYTYTPDADFNGNDSFTYHVSDATGAVDQGTVYINVTAVNDAPTATGDSLTANEDTVLNGSLAGLASDVDGDSLTFTIPAGQGPANGTLSLTTDGTYTYTPTADYNGPDSFTYQVSDGNGGTAQGTVSITVNPVNDPPTTLGDTATTLEDTPVSGDLSGVSSDIDGDTLSFTVLTDPGSAPVGGAVQLASDGSYTFTPDENYNGPASFEYTVSDGNGGTVDGVVNITVSPVNDAPTVANQFVTVEQDDFIESGQIMASDVEGDSLTFSLAPGQSPDGEQFGLDSDGSFYFSGFTPGLERFDIEVSDGTDTTTATLTIATTASGGAEANEAGVSANINTDATPDTPAGSTTIERSPVDATPINIVFALDESGSIVYAADESGTFANAFLAQTNAVRSAITELRAQFQNSTTPVTVKLITFDSGISNSSAAFDLVTDAAAIDAAIDTIETSANGGGTNWAAALDESKTFFDTADPDGDEVNILYLITDGQPSNTDAQIATSLSNLRETHEVDILTFGIGAGFNATKLEQGYTHSNSTTYAFDSDGDAIKLNSASDLKDALTETPLFTPELVSFSLELESDGTDHGVVADKTSDAFEEVNLDFLVPFAKIDGIEDKLGQDNDFIATAVFDTDGDLGTTDDQITVVTAGRISRPADGLAKDGDAQADLLLGGGGNDTFNGGAGDDLLVSGGGADVLNGQADNDTIVLESGFSTTDQTVVNGGAGLDTLKIGTGISGDLTTGVLPNLSITDIEAIDMTNGAQNNLTLTLADVQDLSTEANTDLGTFLTQDVIAIYGDDDTGGAGDTVTLEADPGGSISSAGTTTDADGNTLNIYEYYDGAGTLTGVVGIEDDVTVINNGGLGVNF